MPVTTKELDLYKKNAPSGFDGGPAMPLAEHLHELRNKILLSVFSILVTTLIGFSLSNEIIKLLINIAPSGTTFLQIKPGELFFASMKVALFFGVLTSSPLIILQLGKFVLPGLSIKEKKISISILSATPLLFCTGLLFAYFFVAPSMLNFLFGFGKDIIPSSISIESFISFTLMIMTICGCAFLLPVIMLTLANVGIINSTILLKSWRYALLSSVILGAILTPTPDPFNMSIVSGILIGLYFFSFGLLKLLRL